MMMIIMMGLVCSQFACRSPFETLEGHLFSFLRSYCVTVTAGVYFK